MSTSPNIILFSPIGNRDPWNGWEDSLQKSPDKPYGACFEILNQYQHMIKKVILLPTSKTSSAEQVIKNALSLYFPELTYQWRPTNIEDATNYDEIDKQLKPILNNYHFSSNEIVWVNLTSATPQISKYLETLLLLGFFGKSHQQAKAIEVKDPLYATVENRIIIHEKAKKDPLKALIDASHIAKLIQNYEYSAALKIATSSAYSKMSSHLQFLKNMMDINVSKMNDSQKLLPNLQNCFQMFFPPIIDNEMRNIEALSFWTMCIKFKSHEYKDMVLRAAALREYLAVDCLKELADCTKYINQRDNKYFFEAHLLPEEEKTRLREVGREFYNKPYLWKDSIELMAESSLLLMNFLKHPFKNDFFDSRDIVGYRNKFAHTIQAIPNNDIPKLKSFQSKMIELMKKVRPGENLLWEQNFFDEANVSLLQDFDLAWLIEVPRNKYFLSGELVNENIQ